MVTRTPTITAAMMKIAMFKDSLTRRGFRGASWGASVCGGASGARSFVVAFTEDFSQVKLAL